MNTQPEALRLAAELEDAGKPTFITDAAALELRRLHEENVALWEVGEMRHIKTWQERCEEHPDHNGIVSDGMIMARMQEEIDELRAALEQPNARTLHKMMLAMIKAHWHSIDPQWKNDPELCHALGYEAGYDDAVARRVEPPAAESGAGFESLPASPHKMTESA
jgi:hypothetical protein